MDKTLLFVFLVISSFSFGQNYQTIKSNEINFFGRDNGKAFLATRTDSVQVEGNDSIFYSFKTLRSNDTMTVGGCQYLAVDSWYGDKVIIKDN